jgi:Mg-chelatase subunit ChlD
MKAFYSGFEFRAAVEEVLGKINTSLGLHKITVQWTHEVQTAAINDSGRVLLADVQDDSRIPHATLLRYIGMGAHELCHHAYTDWNVVFAASNDRLLAQLHNAVEDAYIERRAIQSGLTGNIQALFSSLIDGMVAEALADVTDWGNPAQYPFALAVYLRDHATTKVPLAPGLEPIFEEAARQFKSCSSSADALRIAEWVYGQLKFLPEKKKQDKQNKQQGKQQAKPQQGPQKGTGDANEGKDTPTPSPATAPTGKEDFRPVEPTVMSPDSEGTGGSGASYCEETTLYRKGAHVEGKAFDIQITVPGALRYNLKRLFDDTAKVEFGLRRAAGTVDVNALSRLSVSDKIFKRRSETAGVDSAVVLVVDVSSSMRRSRIAPAVQCCAALLDVLDRAGVATAVLSFNHGTSLVKDWNERKALGLDALSRLTPSGGTNDFFAVRYAHKLLLQRREARKVCIVLTDGNGEPEATARQVQAGTNLGITTLGVGIELDVSRVYPQNIKVDNLADLGAASFKQIKLAV